MELQKLNHGLAKWIILMILGGVSLHCPPPDSGDSNLGLLALLATNSTTGPTSSTCTGSAPSGTYLADTVASAPGSGSGLYSDPSLAVNRICGEGTSGGSLDVYQLDTTGSGAEIILEWADLKITNGAGVDFVVFENPFYFNGNSSNRFMEAIVVEVKDETSGNWCGFSPDYNPGGSETDYSTNPAHWVSFAGITPVLYNMGTNPLDAASIFDQSQAGGDGFDLSNLSSSNDFSNGCDSTARANILADGFQQLRLRAATSLTNADSGSAFPQDSGAFGTGPDIDGVIARYAQNR